ncbi:hypothetical protein D3C86_1554850 [compost metagenome]
MRQWPQQLITQQLEVFRRVLAEQGEHPVVRHDRWLLVEQVIFQRSPVQTQGFEEEPVRVVLAKTHLAHGGRYIQAEVLDKPGGGDKTVEQRCGGEFTLDLVIEARTGTGIPCQRSQNTP